MSGVICEGPFPGWQAVFFFDPGKLSTISSLTFSRLVLNPSPNGYNIRRDFEGKNYVFVYISIYLKHRRGCMIFSSWSNHAGGSAFGDRRASTFVSDGGPWNSAGWDLDETRFCATEASQKKEYIYSLRLERLFYPKYSYLKADVFSKAFHFFGIYVKVLGCLLAMGPWGMRKEKKWLSESKFFNRDDKISCFRDIFDLLVFMEKDGKHKLWRFWHPKWVTNCWWWDDMFLSIQSHYIYSCFFLQWNTALFFFKNDSDFRHKIPYGCLSLFAVFWYQLFCFLRFFVKVAYTPWKFNNSPLNKAYHPKRKVVFQVS